MEKKANYFIIKGLKVHFSKTVMNLMKNAFKAMPNVGKITVSTQNRYVDLPIAGYIPRSVMIF